MTYFPAPPKLHVTYVPGVDSDRDRIVSIQSEQTEVCLHEDPEREGCMANWLSALRCAAQNDVDHSWSVILCDDALPLWGWQQHLERACVNSPQPVLGLTHFGGYGTKAVDKKLPYVEGPCMLWGGAIAYNAAIRTELSQWAHHVNQTTGYPHDDRLIAAFMMKKRFETAMVARALFDQPVKKSLLGHNTPIRRPATTIENSPDYSYRGKSKSVRGSCSVKKEIERLSAL